MSDFVTYQIALKLKEKGFPQVKDNTLAMYNEKGEWFSLASTLDKYEYSFEDFDDRDCVCPTIEQSLKWIRETKKIYIVSAYMPKIMHETGISNDFYYPTFQKIGLFEPMFFIGGDDDYDTYEKSILAGIEFILDKWENIKT